MFYTINNEHDEHDVADENIKFRVNRFTKTEYLYLNILFSFSTIILFQTFFGSRRIIVLKNVTLTSRYRVSGIHKCVMQE